MVSWKIESEVDFNFLHALASFQDALGMAVTSPVCVMCPNTSLAMYYDCTDPENIGESIMRRRLRDGKEDIQRHIEFHDIGVKAFYDINDASNRNDRSGVIAVTFQLAEKTREYGLVVDRNKLSLRLTSFLDFPHANIGNYFCGMLVNSDGCGIIRALEFNPKNSFEGLRKGLDNLTQISLGFVSRDGPIPQVPIGNHDTGQGITDNSYRGKFELTKELLRRVGYDC